MKSQINNYLKQLIKVNMRKTKIVPVFVSLAFALVWTGCEKDYNYVAPKAVIPISAVLSYAASVEPIFSKNGCSKSGCHDGSTLELDLTVGNSYAGLIGGGNINTANPESSRLYKSVTASTSSTDFMPKNGSPISDNDAATILAWIKQG